MNKGINGAFLSVVAETGAGGKERNLNRIKRAITRLDF